jgi:NitT/TauT family transport system substrate-binding protein
MKDNPMRTFGTLLLWSLVVLAVGCSGGAKDGNAPSTSGGPSSGATTLGEPSALPTSKEKYTFAVSIYAGWMPWYYAKEQGITSKWAEKYGIEIDTVYMDYVPSVEAFVAGQAQACVMTNMEALNMPAASGIDTTAIIMGDYSNGNDAVLVRDGLTLKTIKDAMLVELTVSQYLLARGLEMEGRSEKDVQLMNVSDSDIAATFLADSSKKTVVTWNPMLLQIEQTPGVIRIFDSAKIPGEILDLCVVNTDVLKKDPRLGLALTGAWYEVLGVMSQRGPAADEAMEQMAKLSGGSLTEYKAQIKTTAMFWTPESAVTFTAGKEIQEAMEKVRQFSFEHGMLGQGTASADVVGISYPDGTIQGDKNKVKFRFTTEYMDKAAKGELTKP